MTDPQGDVEELACLQQDARPLNDAQHHLVSLSYLYFKLTFCRNLKINFSIFINQDEYAESVRIKMKKRTELNYRSPDRLKHSIN